MANSFSAKEFGEVDKAIKDFTESLQQNNLAFKNVAGSYKDSMKALVELNSANKLLAERYDTTTYKVDKNNKQINDSIEQYVNAKNSTADYSKELEQVGKTAKTVGTAMDTYVTKPIIKTGKVALGAWEEIDKAYDNIITKTGATGDKIDELTDSFDTVFGNMPTDATTVSNAISGVHNEFGLMGDELEELSTYMLKYASINNVDVTESTNMAKQAIDAYGLSVNDIPAMMDALTSSSQSSGVSVSELNQKLIDSAPQMKNLGISAQEGANLIGQLERSGIDSSVALESMANASQILTKDGKNLGQGLLDVQNQIKNSTSETEALSIASSIFGSESAPAMVAALKSGTIDFNDFGTAAELSAGKVEQSFNDTLDPMDQSTIAMNNLSLAGSDLTDAVMESLTPVFEFLTDVIKSVVEWFTGLDDSVKTTIAVIGGLVAAIGPLLLVIAPLFEPLGQIIDHFSKATEVAGAASEASTGLGGALSGISVPMVAIIAILALIIAAFIELWNTNEEFRASVESAIASIQEVFQTLWDVILAPILEIIKTTLLDVWENGIQPLWDKWVEFIGDVSIAMMDLWTSIQPIVTWFIETFGPILVAIFELVASTIGNVINTTLGLFGGWFDYIKVVISGVLGVFQGIIDFVTGVFSGSWSKAWDGIKGIFTNIWNTLSGVVSGVWDTILGLFSNGGKIFSGVVDGIAKVFKTIVNSILTGVNNVISSPFKMANEILNGIRNFDIPVVGKVFKGLWSHNPIPVPSIPLLAKGGYLLNGAAIVGEAGPELLMQQGTRTTVAPLSRGGGATPMDVIDYNKMAEANIKALRHLCIRLDDEEVGKFIDNRLLKAVV